MASPPPERSDRQIWMAVLARAGAEEMRSLLAACPELPPHVRLRGPESGLVMLRGRAGGGGAAFNLGEMTVTRCTVRSAGHTGHATVTGREGARAELAARIDAALQHPDWREALQRHMVVPLAEAQEAARDGVARRAAATRVQFFTMATMRS